MRVSNHVLTRPRRRLRHLLLALPLLALAACETNPATGERAFTGFMPESQEVAIGTGEHPKILKEFGGAYQDENLQKYVQNLGWALSQVSEKPELPYTFTVLDSDVVNAFALPGGFVYITRALLAQADNEAQVAAVLGHEIGHVVARHSAQRYSQAMAANIGLSVLGVLGSAAGVPGGVGQLASFGAQAYLQSFSREQELESDMLGVRYMAKLGYEPRESIRMLERLQDSARLEAAISGNPNTSDQFNIMSTHPRTADRVARAIELADLQPVTNPLVARDTYLAKIEGMVYGDNPDQGVRSGRAFAHPKLGIRFEVPPGFTLFNNPTQVVARGPDDSVIVFDMVPPKQAERVEDVYAYLTRDWGSYNLRDAQRITVNGLKGATARARIATRKGPLDLRLVAIHGTRQHIYRFAFLSKLEMTARLADDYQRTTYSFRRLALAEAAAIKPLRLHIMTVKAGDTADSLAARMPFETLRLERFLALNGLERDQPLAAGQKVKIVQ